MWRMWVRSTYMGVTLCHYHCCQGHWAKMGMCETSGLVIKPSPDLRLEMGLRSGPWWDWRNMKASIIYKPLTGLKACDTVASDWALWMFLASPSDLLRSERWNQSCLYPAGFTYLPPGWTSSKSVWPLCSSQIKNHRCCCPSFSSSKVFNSLWGEVVLDSQPEWSEQYMREKCAHNIPGKPNINHQFHPLLESFLEHVYHCVGIITFDVLLQHIDPLCICMIGTDNKSSAGGAYNPMKCRVGCGGVSAY